MVIPNHLEQSTADPIPQKRLTKARRFIDKYNEGSDSENGDNSGNDTNGRQYDTAGPERGQFFEPDTVGDEKSFRNYASAELEGSDGVEQPADHDGRKRKLPENSDSGSDSFAEVAASAQIKASDELGHTALADNVCVNRYSELLASLAENLQCIRKYRTSAFYKNGHSHFELECLMRDGQWCWIAEVDI